MPGLADAYCPAQPGVAVAADPDRYSSAAVVLVVVPGGAHCPEVIVGQRPALLEPNSECFEFLPRPADAHAEDQPSPLSWLRLVAIRAMRSGWRYGTMRTVVPSRTLLVIPASQARVVKGS